MNDRIRGLAPQTSFTANAPSGNPASSAVLISTATDGIVDDLGNLVQIARSTESIVSLDPTAKAADDPGPANTCANASLEQTGVVPGTLGRDAL